MNGAAQDLLDSVSPKVRERGEQLLGEVRPLGREGETFHAQVQGSRRTPYRVTVDLRAGHVRCSCPDEYNVICKHACAALLLIGWNPALFSDALPPRRLPPLKGWAEGDVKRLLDRLEKLYPEVVEGWVQERAEAGGKTKRKAPRGETVRP